MSAATDALVWRWWAGLDEEEYRLAGPCRSRKDAIAEAYGDTEPGDTIHLVEAVVGEWDEHDGLYEFTHTRNRSSVIRGHDRFRAVAFRGATAWEAQVGRAWVRINFPRFWRTSGLGKIGWERGE